MEEERRRFKRFDAYMNVRFQSEEEASSSGVCLSKDLSRDGIKLTTNAKLGKGALVNLEIDIPDDPKTVYGTGEVVWASKVKGSESDFELGIKFLMMDPVDKFRVLDYAYNNWLESKVDDYDDPEQVKE